MTESASEYLLCQYCILAEEILWNQLSYLLDLGSGHTTHRRILLIDLYLHAKFRSNWKTFYGRTDVHWDRYC